MTSRFLTVLAVVGTAHLAAGAGLLLHHRVTRPAPPEAANAAPQPAPAPAPGGPLTTAAARPGTPTGTPSTRPAPTTQPAAQSTTTPAASTASHKVASGESYIRIARRYNVTLDELLAANGHTASRTLQVGETLILPPHATLTP